MNVRAGECQKSSVPRILLVLRGSLLPWVGCECLEINDHGSVQPSLRSVRQPHDCFGNCLQGLACICWVLSLINDVFYQLARIIDFIADVVFHTIAGCMSAQVAYEIKYQAAHGSPAQAIATPAYVAPSVPK